MLFFEWAIKENDNGFVVVVVCFYGKISRQQYYHITFHISPNLCSGIMLHYKLYLYCLVKGIYPSYQRAYKHHIFHLTKKYNFITWNIVTGYAENYSKVSYLILHRPSPTLRTDGLRICHFL